MSTNPATRPSSRRSFLTAAAAGITAGSSTLAVSAAVAAADPIFALIEAEACAYAAIDEAFAPFTKAEEAWMASGFDRRARVQTGTLTTIVDRNLNPLPMAEWKDEPVYSYSREDIERVYSEPVAAPITVVNGDRKVTVTTERSSQCEAALAAFEADEARIDAARKSFGVDELQTAFHAACGAHDDALVAVFKAIPTTLPGFLAMLDLFERRSAWTEHDDLLDDVCSGLVAGARAVLV